MAGWPTEQVGSSGENVRTVQYLLQAHGASLVVDGVFGPATKASVQSFQSSHGLTADGIVGSLTWPALVITVSSGSTGQAVSAVQSQMTARIGRPSITGAFDADTNDLVRQLQQDLGLVVDGIVGSLTWREIVTGGLGQKSGQDAAQAVFHAWMHHDSAAARLNATAGAVAALFARTYSPLDGWTFVECEGAAGSVYCSWHRPGGQLVFRSNNNTGAPFYFVSDVQFTP